MAKKIRGRNEGSLYQRSNGTWRAQVSLGGQRLTKGFDTKADALEWLRKTQVEVFRGIDYHGGKTTLAQYLPQWLTNSRSGLREKTSQQYQQIINKHILPHIGEVQLRNLGLIKIEQFYTQLVRDGVGIRTVRITHSILHRALDKAVRYGLVSNNPAHGATLPRYKHGEMQILDESQVSRLLIAAQGSPYQPLYHLAVTTGLRQGELLALTWTDLQWTSGTFHVQRQVQVVRGKGWSLLEPKTRAGRRTIKLGAGTLHMLRQQKEHQEFLKTSSADHWQNHDLVFTSKVGTPVDPSNLRLDFYRILHRAGLPKIRFHDLRHTAASLLLNNGVPTIVVSKILGHSKPSITLDIYGHLINEMQEEAARIMDGLVTPIPIVLAEKVARDLHNDK